MPLGVYRMKTRNRGFALMEAVVVFLLMGIVSGILWGRINTDDVLHRSAVSKVDLQTVALAEHDYALSNRSGFTSDLTVLPGLLNIDLATVTAYSSVNAASPVLVVSALADGTCVYIETSNPWNPSSTQKGIAEAQVVTPTPTICTAAALYSTDTGELS
jgi:hypothetical protein